MPNPLEYIFWRDHIPLPLDQQLEQSRCVIAERDSRLRCLTCFVDLIQAGDAWVETEVSEQKLDRPGHVLFPRKTGVALSESVYYMPQREASRSTPRFLKYSLR
jgi:hypothetical protein